MFTISSTITKENAADKTIGSKNIFRIIDEYWIEYEFQEVFTFKLLNIIIYR